jgi:beta-mannosidase
MTLFRIVALLLLLGLHSAQAQTHTRLLDKADWKFKKPSETSWLPATVPGTVHTDLFANKIIPDPFYGDHESHLQWIESENWEYQSSFNLSADELKHSNVELQFDGLDTYANVYLNDSLLLQTDNMFRTWKTEVKRFLKPGNNKLFIVFESAVNRGKLEAQKLSYTLPGDERVFTRKAQYQYGWDWGPRFVTCGIWKSVKLNFWTGARIADVYVIQKMLTDKLGALDFACEFQADSAGEYSVAVDLLEGENCLDCYPQTVTLKQGSNFMKFQRALVSPQRWWSRGLGEAHLYPFRVTISKRNTLLDSSKLKVGFRTLELVQDPDSEGMSFYFKLNGIPVFMKGANFIPPDNFLPRIKPQDYAQIVKNAAEANMNMLRVWGGGTYADDEFYNQCDAQGILVWQDFMFACAMYPGNKAFYQNVSYEAVDQIKRLRNHASLALWCGNNEVDEGWKNWGWQKQFNYSAQDSATIAQDNKRLFEGVLKSMVFDFDFARAYWPSSPSIGWGHKESLTRGDSHYWGVWWGMEPLEIYNKKVGRFMSEYGFQGMPPLSSFQKMGAFQNLKIDSSNFLPHQKHPKGYQTIDAYMKRDYPFPIDFEHYIYVSQLLQARSLKIAIEAHRRAKPYCMGSLYWQLNDCWPVTSWSSMDYYNQFKASHYQAKRSFQDIILSIVETDSECLVYAISDVLQKHSGLFSYGLYNLKGEKITENQFQVFLDSNASNLVCKLSKKAWKHFDKNNLLLKCELEIENYKNENPTVFHYFAKPKDLKLLKPKIDIKVTQEKDFQQITLQSDVLVKDLYIQIKGENINLRDNFFDLLPGQTKYINLYSDHQVKDLKRKIKVMSLVDTF